MSAGYWYGIVYSPYPNRATNLIPLFLVQLEVGNADIRLTYVGAQVYRSKAILSLPVPWSESESPLQEGHTVLIGVIGRYIILNLVRILVIEKQNVEQ